MMTRLWPASLALALIFGAGQALAADTCRPFGTVTITPAPTSLGKISVTNCTVVNSLPTPSADNFYVQLTNASVTTTTSECEYEDKVETTKTAIIIDSKGSITANCKVTTHPPSDSAVFTTNPALGATAAAIVGVPLVLTVTRTKGTVSSATLGLDSLSVAETTTVGAQINPSTFSFNDNEPSLATRTSNIVFTKAGDAVLEVKVNSVALSTKISVKVSGSSCDGIPVPPYAVDGDATTAHSLIAASASERASGAIRFAAPANGSRTLTLRTPPVRTPPYPVLSSLDIAISTCPGDFLLPASTCKVPGANDGKTIKIAFGSGAASDCVVPLSTPYYVNVRSVTPGRDVGLHLSTTSPQLTSSPP